MHNTKIQWCDGTVSPVPTCDGCPLRQPEAVVKREIKCVLRKQGISQERIAEAILSYETSSNPSRRQRIQTAMAMAFQGEAIVQGKKDRALELTRSVYKQTSSCYAGILTDNRGGKVKGYAERFDQITLFPGRTRQAARQRSPRRLKRPGKPWLDGCPYLWFVNDMGDALSGTVPFEFLYQEIVEVAASEAGQRSRWLWLTKRPQRMAEFCRWLAARGVPWPQNLVPMTSVINRVMATKIRHLRGIPAAVRGLSVEPLWEPVQLDLTGIGWVIVGGESGPLSKPFDLVWTRDLREQCRAADVAFFVKQLGSNPVEDGRPLKLKDKHGGDWQEWPEDLRIREVPRAFLIGKNDQKEVASTAGVR